MSEQKKRRVTTRSWDRATNYRDELEKVLPVEELGWREKNGWFAGYGLEVVEMETVASQTVAIVEFDDGTVELINVSNIKFL